MSINKKKPDDLDRTIKKLRKNPEFEKEWQASEAEYQLGRQLIKARIYKRLTQAALAKKAGTTQAVISRIESGSVSPSLNLVSRISMAMGKKLILKFV